MSPETKAFPKSQQAAVCTNSDPDSIYPEA